MAIPNDNAQVGADISGDAGVQDQGVQPTTSSNGEQGGSQPTVSTPTSNEPPVSGDRDQEGSQPSGATGEAASVTTDNKQTDTELVNFIVQDRNRYIEALKYKGYSEEHIDKVVTQIETDYPNLWKKEQINQDPKKQQEVKPLTAEQVREEIRRANQEDEIARVEKSAHTDFFKLYPEFAPDTVRTKSPDEGKKLVQQAYLIEDQARLLMHHNKLDYSSALRKAHSMVTGESERTFEGYETNTQNSQNISGMGAKSSPSAGAGGGTRSVAGLTPTQREWAGRLGMTLEEYAANLEVD